MKTIVHVIDSLSVGGAEVLLANTVPLLKNYNNIICYLHKPDDLVKQFNGFNVHYIGFEKKSDIFKAVYRLRKLISNSKANIVHSQLLWSTWLSRLACPSNVQLVFSIQNMLSKDAFEVNRLSLYAERLTYSKKQIAICCSDVVKKDYNHYIGLKGRNFILYNFIDDIFFRKGYKPRTELNGTLRLLCVGNLRRQKNYLRILEAFVFLKNYNIYLDIYGIGELHDELASFIKKNQIKVFLKGRANDRVNIYPQYDAFVMCSLFEGFSLALVEAMALGLPVIVSDIDVLREAVEECGLYFDPKNAENIAEVILQVFNQWNSFRKLSSNNSDFIKSKGSKTIYIEKLTKIYDLSN